MAQRYREFACKTIDGITLRGWFYEVAGPAPAIVMSHGFNCVKEMLLPETAEAFQSLGYNVLLYDARSIGSSDGQPRNLSSPYQMAEDVSDLVSFAMTLPSVDSRKVLLWAMSFGAAVNACTVAVDRRPLGLVMICPLLSFIREDRRERAFAQLMRDRSSQLQGNPPLSVPPFNAKADNLIGMGGAGGPGGIEARDLMNAASERGHPNFSDRIALQTYHKLALFRPKEIMQTIQGVPVLMVIPELDTISSPKEQKQAFDQMKTPKRMYWAKDKGHLSILTGEGSVEVFKATADFFRDALSGNVH
ncbi:Alpha/Beta hydrolase protein [Coniella lustricola]|uniref:Alpha/Beta hydrolase protein n=1 Tax=Coniella lustricola TaxID=2025994 RepID=A0A2T3A098_9PEZI|nr:Alpha/Beta hydrolase protein [Coniella lustricola]